VRLVATDTVFSMDGDLAPLTEMLALCEQHDAWLLLDDAHGVGVLGESAAARSSTSR
jgi:8-amino-7-oxononanoate synthase